MQTTELCCRPFWPAPTLAYLFHLCRENLATGASNLNSLEYTGERMVPGLADGGTFWEHVSRYRFASSYVAGRDVLDIACGEGYGTAALLRAGAKSVVGIDVAPDAVAHTRRKYGVQALVGSAELIPLGTATIDVIVSFETIEHVQSPATFLGECVRVLRPGGVLVISTPNRDVYGKGLPANPFHCSEMTLSEFRSVVELCFVQVQYFGQCWPAPWYLSRRGFGRCTRVARRVFGDRAMVASDGADSQSVVELCSRELPALDPVLWTDSVSRCSDAVLPTCKYIIAVASRQVPRQ